MCVLLERTVSLSVGPAALPTRHCTHSRGLTAAPADTFRSRCESALPDTQCPPPPPDHGQVALCRYPVCMQSAHAVVCLLLQLPLRSVGFLLAVRMGLVHASALVRALQVLLQWRWRRSARSSQTSPLTESNYAHPCGLQTAQFESSCSDAPDDSTSHTRSDADGPVKCPLCREFRFRSPGVTTCGHVFCYQCVVAWLDARPLCPICRQQQLPQQVRALYQYA